MRKPLLPMKLQFFAEGDGASGQGDSNNQQQNQQQQQQSQNQQGTSPAFDYDKLAGIIAGKQTVAEDTVLKSFFKQQGLSQEEMNQAIQAFKTEKAKNNPDVAAIQTQLAQVQAIAEKAEIEKLATLEAVGLGIDAKTLPYVLKMADLNQVKGQDGKVNQEAVKNALNKVLEDVPQLKPVAGSNQGFQIGGAAGEAVAHRIEAARQRHAVVLDIADLEPARIEIASAVGHLADGHAGGVLQHDEAGAREVGVVGLDGSRDVGNAQAAVRLRLHRLGLDGAQHGHATRLPAVGVPALAHDGLVAALAVAPQRDQVGLRAGGGEQRRLKTQQLGRMVLQCVHRRVVGKHIVAQRGLEHGLAHGGRGLGDGVAAEVGHGWREEAKGAW